MTQTIWTVGHSTRTIGEFIAALHAHGIEAIVDVRRYPGSRRLPQFGGEALARSLAETGIDYVWLPELGGRRRSGVESRNLAWRHPAFRAYADHMESEEFAAGLFELLVVAHEVRCAVMCAEALWWRCHRRLIADVLTSLRIQVVHIRDERASEVHRIAAPARVVNGELTYRPAGAPASG